MIRFRTPLRPLRQPTCHSAWRGKPRHVRVLSRTAAITKRADRGACFTIVAVEADWPDAAAADRYVRRRPARAAPDPPFQRFPTWMWRNTDVTPSRDAGA